jgi:hypothetical protein
VRDDAVGALSRDDGSHAYAKWQGAFWRLLSLVDLGVEPGHPGAVAAAERTLAWVADPERLTEVADRREARRRGTPAGRGPPAMRAGAPGRRSAALDLLESKRRPDGTWRVEGKWWKRPGSPGSNIEVVDWGETANAVLTEQALGVRAAAGRL